MTDHNYYRTFIAVADDCPVSVAEEPPSRGSKPTAAQVHLKMAGDQGYAHTQEQILFRTHLNAKGLDPAEHPEGGARWQEFFAKGQPCLRTSALGKRYGWGLHFDDRGRVHAVPLESAAYKRLANDDSIRQLKAMGSSRR